MVSGFRMNPYQIVKDFESALCDYTGAPYAVTVNSCTMALFLCLTYFRSHIPGLKDQVITIPKHTYVGVAMSVLNAGFKIAFKDIKWEGEYGLDPLGVYDRARWLCGGMYENQHNIMMCLSFHPTKHLGISTHGGAILVDDEKIAAWLKRARFDGRTEGVPVQHDTFNMLGWHCYMAPSTAAEGLERLSRLPRDNDPLPNDDYPDLSLQPLFQ